LKFGRIIKTFYSGHHHKTSLKDMPDVLQIVNQSPEVKNPKEVSPKENSRDDQQETLLVALIDNNVKLARRP
jgi:hypothetical protein